jgi:hypothetical protein
MNVASAASVLAPVNGAKKSLIVEGWRFLPHSYAIVNQWQLLALLRIIRALLRRVPQVACRSNGLVSAGEDMGSHSKWHDE